MTMSFDIKQLPALGAHVGKALDDAGKRALLSASIRIVGHIQNELIPAAQPQPVDTGIFRSAWKSIASDRGADVFNDAPHAPFIEYGVRGENIRIGKKMIAALAAWASRHGMVSTHSTSASGKKRKRTSTERANEANQVAWAIAISMQKRGIFNRGQGFHFIDKAQLKAEEFIREELVREISRIGGA